MSELEAACTTGNVDFIKKLLSKDVYDINSVDVYIQIFYEICTIFIYSVLKLIFIPFTIPFLNGVNK